MVQPGGIVIIGNREGAQMACIDRGISSLIVTGGTDVTAQVKAAAERARVVVIVTPHDTYTAARLINQSIPVSMVMERNVVAFSPTTWWSISRTPSSAPSTAITLFSRRAGWWGLSTVTA
jgi:manganese-dependent inorganic pyrophosphatase